MVIGRVRILARLDLEQNRAFFKGLRMYSSSLRHAGLPILDTGESSVLARLRYAGIRVKPGMTAGFRSRAYSVFSSLVRQMFDGF